MQRCDTEEKAQKAEVSMDGELLKALSVITEEEQTILDGNRGIEQKRYTEKKELILSLIHI